LRSHTKPEHGCLSPRITPDLHGLPPFLVSRPTAHPAWACRYLKSNFIALDSVPIRWSKPVDAGATEFTASSAALQHSRFLSECRPTQARITLRC
jgi:hypothetical protein